MESENRVKKHFGTLAMEKGLITLDQLVDAVNVQIRENEKHRRHRLIGAILMEQGAITNPQVFHLLESQKRLTH
jgi:hypothetical protein